MSWVSGTVIYIVVWWMVFLPALSFGVQKPDQEEIGHANGAPKNPMLIKKALITTVIAASIWYIIFEIINSGYFDLRPKQVP